MKQRAAYKFRRLTVLLIFVASSGCSLFSSDEDPGRKNNQLKYEDPAMPYRKIDESTADSVWQSDKTGNTIALNSLCKKSDESLKSMEDSILAGIEHLKNRNSQKIKIDGTEADRVHAEGITDGELVDVDLVVLKKSDCTYDIAYVARHSTFNEEVPVFDKFLERFHAP